VSGNTAGSSGGGIFNSSSATLTLTGATDIQTNTARSSGGGIANIGSVTAAADWTGSVSGNSPDNCEPTLILGGTTCT